MKRISERAHAVLADLQRRRRSFLGRGFNESLHELAALGEPATIPHLTPILFYGSPSERSAVAAVINELLDKMRAEDFAELGERVRACWRLDEDFRRIDSTGLAKPADPTTAGRLLIQMSTMHPNGYVRDEAVKRLGLVRDGTELPYLLLRLNDWVPAVRHTALATINERLTPDYAGHFLDHLILVIRLEYLRRADHGDCLKRIFALLSTPAALDRLRIGIHDADKRVRRKCLDLLLAAEDVDLEQSLELARSSTDAVLRMRAVDQIASAAPATLAHAQLRQALHDPFFAIRRAALRHFVARFPREAQAQLYDSLFDPSAGVRATARYHLTDLLVSDVPSLYRSALASGNVPKLHPALSGLAECGNSADLHLILPFLDHPVALVRIAAVKGVAGFAREHCAERLFPLISDKSAGVSKAARISLSPYADSIGGARLFELALHSGEAHVWHNTIRLMAALSKWEALLHLIRATNEASADRATLASSFAMRIDPQFLSPSAAQIQAIRKELATPAMRSPPNRRWTSKLRFALDVHSTPT